MGVHPFEFWISTSPKSFRTSRALLTRTNERCNEPLFHYTGLLKRDLYAGLFQFAINPKLRILGGGNSLGGLVARNQTTTSIFPLQSPPRYLGRSSGQLKLPLRRKLTKINLVALRIRMMLAALLNIFLQAYLSALFSSSDKTAAAHMWIGNPLSFKPFTLTTPTP